MGIEFNKCCFCVDLRTGCLIIGYLNLIGNIALILLSIIGLGAAAVGSARSKDMGTHPGADPVSVLLAILLDFFILFLAFTIILLVGLHKHKRGHVKAYLTYTLIFIVLSIIMFFASFVFIRVTVFRMAKDIISILLNIYFFLVIRSYYLKMDDPVKKPAVYNTA